MHGRFVSAHTLEFYNRSLRPSLGSRCFSISCRPGLHMVMKLTEECKKNHEKERARLNDTPTAKSQWCQLLEKKMCTGIYSSYPNALKNFRIPSITSLSPRHTPKSSCMYHMTFKERVLKTLTLCLDRKGSDHCEISQLNQFPGSD